MLVEQGGIEGSSSPMEVSTQEVESKETVKEETIKPTKEVATIQFGSQPEVQVNMVIPCSMIFFKNGQTSKNQDDTWLNLSKPDISEDTRSDDELTIICNDCDLEEVAQIEMDDNLVCEIEHNQESLEVSLKESACFVPDSMSDTEYPLVIDLNYFEISYPFKLPNNAVRQHLRPLL